MYLLTDKDWQVIKFECTEGVALEHLKSEKGFVYDYEGGKYSTLEELENYVEGIRPESGTGSDSGHSGDGEVSEASYSKLFGTLGDSTE